MTWPEVAHEWFRWFAYGHGWLWALFALAILVSWNLIGGD